MFERLSPDSTNSIAIEDFLAADNEHLLDLSLSDQHPVKRILMRSRQHPRTNPVVIRHRDAEKTFPLKISAEVLDQLGSRRKLSQSKLGRNLPSRNSAHKDAISRLSN